MLAGSPTNPLTPQQFGRSARPTVIARSGDSSCSPNCKWERIPQDDLDKLPGDVIVFASATHNLGEVFPLSLGWEGDEQRRGGLVYLSPQLERKSQAEVDSTVAHEFARVVLGCHRSDYTRNIYPQGVEFETQGDIPSEQDSDALISHCGYKPAYKSIRKKPR